jgi:hypothetical protein
MSACASGSVHLAGRVVADGIPVSGARVSLDAVHEPVRLEAISGSDGVYRFPPLPPGQYRLEARRAGNPTLGAIPGKNPLHLAPGSEVWLGLQAVPREEPGFRSRDDTLTGFGAVTGTVRHRGLPVADAVVNLYLDETTGLRGPGFRQSFPTGPDGAYWIEELPEGQYHLMARKRRRGLAGPVREGDLYGPALANPVLVRSQEETVLDIHVVRKERDDDINVERLALGGTGIRGHVVDPTGRPVAGVYVFAYRNRVVGHGMPDYLTLPTGPDGAFALAVGDGGLVYLGARERAGGSPAPGELFGFYEGAPDHGIVVPRGKVVPEVEIVVRHVLEPSGARVAPAGQGQAPPTLSQIPENLSGDLHTMPT